MREVWGATHPNVIKSQPIACRIVFVLHQILFCEPATVQPLPVCCKNNTFYI